MKTPTHNLEKLSNSDAIQFITDLLNDMDSLEVDIEGNLETDQTAKFYKALKQLEIMAKDQELQELDLERKKNISAIHLYIDSYKDKKERQIRVAYIAARNIIDSHPDINMLSHETENSIIYNFLAEWNKSENANHVKALNLSIHLTNLEKALVLFDNAFNDRTITLVHHEVPDLSTIREQILKTYKSLLRL